MTTKNPRKTAAKSGKGSSLIGLRIRERRKKLGWSLQYLSTLAEPMTHSYLSRIERGQSGFTPDTLQRLAGALGVSVAALYEVKGNVEFAEPDFRRVPVIDLVQAGDWRSVQESLADGDIRDYIMTNLELPASVVAMRVKGDSMEPQFHEGDIVIVVPSLEPRIGDFVIASNEAGEATLKKYAEPGRNEKGQKVFELVPLNPLYPRWRSDLEQIAIVGVVVEHRTYRKR